MVCVRLSRLSDLLEFTHGSKTPTGVSDWLIRGHRDFAENFWGDQKFSTKILGGRKFRAPFDTKLFI